MGYCHVLLTVRWASNWLPLSDWQDRFTIESKYYVFS
jgi:hypothetical protein